MMTLSSGVGAAAAQTGTCTPPLHFRSQSAHHSHGGSGDFRHAALPGSDVLVYTRVLDWREGPFDDSPPLIGVLWAGPDQVLHQRVWAPTLRWLPVTPLPYLIKAGAFAGAWTGTRFRDTEVDIGHKTIQRIVGRAGDALLGMQLLFTDGSSTPWRGSASSGDRQEFVLSEGRAGVDLCACCCVAESTARRGYRAGHGMAQRSNHPEAGLHLQPRFVFNTLSSLRTDAALCRADFP
jgi:hypothetical protein